MFSSLRKIDIVATSPAGAMTLVQTDHRTPAEVGEDQGLSMIFALTRMLVPRTGEYAEATVQYACVGAVHPLLETAAAACGADWRASACGAIWRRWRSRLRRTWPTRRSRRWGGGCWPSAGWRSTRRA